ncbi:MAG: ribosomal protein [Deltaproteobacteria bacterium]|nr:ribosomal protein [Deltaproteobacteria bacterium]
MALGLIGKKLGMSQIFDEHGNVIPVTVIKAGPCYVVQKKSAEKEGYNAVQIGFDEVIKVQRVNKPEAGHFKKADLTPTKILKEFTVTPEDHEAFRHGGSIGQNMTPGRTMKGKKMPGHMGSKKVTVQSLKIIDVRSDVNLLLIEGAIPGPATGYVVIKPAIKKPAK